MRSLKSTFGGLLIVINTLSCLGENPFLKTLKDTISKVDAHVAVSIDFISKPNEKPIHFGVNENDSMVTMSVIKFPIAVSTLHAVESSKLSLNQMVFFDSVEIHRTAYSPILEEHKSTFSTTLEQALSYSVSRSDNVATDIVLDAMKGPRATQNYLTEKGFSCMQIGSAYRDMTVENRARNWSTSQCMNNLLIGFYQGKMLNPEHTRWLYKQMLESPTTSKRLKGKLPEGTAVAHKTGTMYDDSHPNYEEAINDVGIIQLPNGGVVILSVFVNDSHTNAEKTEDLIAQIAWMCYKQFNK